MIDGLPIDSSETEVLPGIKIDHELKCDNHVNNLCKKLNALPVLYLLWMLAKSELSWNQLLNDSSGTVF